MAPHKTGNKSISFQTKRKSHWSKEGYWIKNDGLYNARGQTLVEVASQFFSKHRISRDVFLTFQSSIRIRKLSQKCKENKNLHTTSKRLWIYCGPYIRTRWEMYLFRTNKRRCMYLIAKNTFTRNTNYTIIGPQL